jgi:hypothetical protein
VSGGQKQIDINYLRNHPAPSGEKTMPKTISTTWPWDLCSVEQVVQYTKALNADEICLRAIDGPTLCGLDDGTRQRWQGKTHSDLERAAKDAGLTVSIWCVVYLRMWQKETERLKEAMALYNPTSVFLDAERKEFIANLGPFLRALGRLSSPVYLQSFRRADGHPEMAWQKWYTYRDETTGEYLIDGLGHQLYPIGWNTPQQWVEQFKRDIGTHEREITIAGRPDLPWFPTVPVFVGGAAENAPGWRPTPEALQSAIEWMIANLGSRLVGVNFWCLDRHLAKLPDLFQMVANLKLPGALAPRPIPEPQPEPEPKPATLADWAAQMDAWARTRGYTGPKPPAE